MPGCVLAAASGAYGRAQAERHLKEVLRRTALVKNLSDSAVVFVGAILFSKSPYVVVTPLHFGKSVRYGQLTDMLYHVAK